MNLKKLQPDLILLKWNIAEKVYLVNWKVQIGLLKNYLSSVIRSKIFADLRRYVGKK